MVDGFLCVVLVMGFDFDEYFVELVMGVDVDLVVDMIGEKWV